MRANKKPTKHVYLAGPMSGIPHMNFHAFDQAADALRRRGYQVTSPAELDSPKERAAALASKDGDLKGIEATWGTLLARDLKIIADGGVEAIVVLPGWEKSKGARLETFVGRLLRLPILAYSSLNPIEQYHLECVHALMPPGMVQGPRPPEGTNLSPGEVVNWSGVQPIDTAESVQADREVDEEDYGEALLSAVREEDEIGPMKPLFDLRLRTTPERYGEAPEVGPHIIPLHECGIEPSIVNVEATPEGGVRKKENAEPMLWRNTSEIRVTDPKTGGQKGSKLAVLGDIDPLTLTELAKVAGFGRKKYDRLNYALGFDWSLAYDALQRHLHAFWNREELDEESGLHHLAHAAWQCLCLLCFVLRKRGTDDRMT